MLIFPNYHFNMVIVGVSGKKGSGKTTVAKIISNEVKESIIISIAGPIKDIASEILKIPIDSPKDYPIQFTNYKKLY